MSLIPGAGEPMVQWARSQGPPGCGPRVREAWARPFVENLCLSRTSSACLVGGTLIKHTLLVGLWSGGWG